MNTKKTNTLATTAVTLALVSGAALADLSWDGNGDGMLDPDEWNMGFNTEERFGSYDTNTDGLLDESEFTARFGEEDMGLYDGNGDGMIDSDELTSGAYERYDADRSGMIEEPELGQANDDMGDGGLFGM